MPGVARALILALSAPLAIGCSGGGGYACPAPESCGEIAEDRTIVEAEYRARLDRGQYSALTDAGRCSAALTARAVVECAADECAEICRLHPAVDTAECVELCAAARPRFETSIPAILDAAARTPGIATCDICPREAFGFCMEIFGCYSG